MIVLLKPCKWNDSKVARVFLSLVQASEDIVSVDRGKLHSSAWIKDVCGICPRITTMASTATKFLPSNFTSFFSSKLHSNKVCLVSKNLVPCTFLSLTLAWTKASFV